MSNEQHIHELIDQYLSGELIGQELDKFKIRLKDDPAFLKQVQIQKAIIQSIEASREAELRAMLSQKNTSKKRAFIIPFQKRTLSIAAAILVFIAVGILIKTQFPNGFNNLAENKPAIAKDEDKNSSDDIDSENNLKGTTQVDADSTEFDVTTDELAEQKPAIPFVEDELTTETDDPIENSTLNNEPINISDLKEDEDVINTGDADYVPQRDSMICQKSISLYVFAENVSKTNAERATEVTIQSDEKKKLFERKKNNDDDKEVSDADVEEIAEDNATSDNTKYLKSVSGTIRVEFWVSVVNFKGYKFDGQKLLLFDTKPNTLITVSKLNGQSFVSKNGVYYKIIPNNSFNQLIKVTDPEILKALATR